MRGGNNMNNYIVYYEFIEEGITYDTNCEVILSKLDAKQVGMKGGFSFIDYVRKHSGKRSIVIKGVFKL